MMTRGDLVQTLFDQGGDGRGVGGVETVYGQVIQAGPHTYTVEWESGNRNRIRQGDTRHVMKCRNDTIEEAAIVMRKHFDRNIPEYERQY